LSFSQAESCVSFGTESNGGATRVAIRPDLGVIRLRD
jgi:hypothetical protein